VIRQSLIVRSGGCACGGAIVGIGFSLRFLGEADGRLAEQRAPLAVRDLLGFESWLERGRVMMLDFSPEVVAFSS
jgi:hypothetical protein